MLRCDFVMILYFLYSNFFTQCSSKSPRAARNAVHFFITKFTMGVPHPTELLCNALQCSGGTTVQCSGRSAVALHLYSEKNNNYYNQRQTDRQTDSTVQYSTVQYSTVQYSTVQYSTVQYSTVQYSTVQYSSASDVRFKI